MLYGAVLRPPSFAATLDSLDTGGVAGVAVRDGDFAGCAAATSYAARKGVEALAAKATWKTKPHPAASALWEHLRATAQKDGRGAKPQVSGDVDAALGSASRRLKATYTTAYVQHAPMEPRAAVAEWSGGKLTVWTGTSNPFSVRDQLAQAFRMPASSIRVIVPDMGGGFGGKHTGEAAVEAARLAKAAGKPVSLRWTRAEEFAWAYARPAALIDVEAGLDAAGKIVAWSHVNINSGASALASPYRLANSRHQFLPADSPLRQGSYRCLAATANNFARESFMDELAAAAGADPLEFRLAHLENQRIKDVLLAAAKKFHWEERRKSKRPVGLACGTEKNSVVAACVEVEVDPKTREVRLKEICEAFECGPVLNPLGLRSQVEGCIVMGLGAALREEMQFENGMLTNARFSAYRVPRFRDVPRMDLIFLERKDLEPAGAGETPIIVVAPAMGNAIFAATGERLRSLPLKPGGRKL
jgi:isoquinoline 1-oxidoreductase